jgi:hypothetical protein
MYNRVLVENRHLFSDLFANLRSFLCIEGLLKDRVSEDLHPWLLLDDNITMVPFFEPHDHFTQVLIARPVLLQHRELLLQLVQVSFRFGLLNDPDQKVGGDPCLFLFFSGLPLYLKDL